MNTIEYRKDWFNVQDPWIDTKLDLMYYRVRYTYSETPFVFPMPKDELTSFKEEAAIDLSNIFNFPTERLNKIAEYIDVIDFSLSPVPSDVFILIKIENLTSFLEENQKKGKFKEKLIRDFVGKMIKLTSLVEKMAKDSKKNKRKYSDFSFDKLSRDLNSLFYKYKNYRPILASPGKKLGEAMTAINSVGFNLTMTLRLEEDYSIVDLFDTSGRAVPAKHSPLQDKRVCSVLYHIDNILGDFSEENPFSYEDQDRFVELYVRPKPETTFTPNLGITDTLIETILGDKSLLNGKYKPTREEYKEEFKQQLFNNIRNESENVNDPVLQEILLSAGSVNSMEGLYEEILNRIPIEDLIALALKCLAKLIPVNEIKKAICSKIVKSISESELKSIITYLEMAGEELHSKIASEISELGLSENQQALLDYTLANPDSEELICLAVFAAIPAAIYLLYQLIENGDAIKDKIKEDYYLVKKAVDKRIQFLFEDIMDVFDILSAVRDGLIEAAESFIASTFMWTVQKILVAIDQACDSREQDFANATTSPLARLNINDLLKNTEKNRNRPPTPIFSEPNVRAYLDELSNLLSLTELCLLLNGNFKPQILDIAFSLLKEERHEQFKKKVGGEGGLKEFLIAVGKNVDKSYCEDALSTYEQQKKILIEICSDTTDMKKKLYEQIYGGKFSPEDILRQLQKESDLNKERLENLVDAMRPEEFLPKLNCTDRRHKSQEFLTNTVVRENIKAIGKQFEQDAGGFKQIFLSNNNYFGSLGTAISGGVAPTNSTKAAPELVSYLEDRSKITTTAKEDNADIFFADGSYEAMPNLTKLSIGNRVVTKPKKIFEEFADEILATNKLDTSVLSANQTKYFDKVVETAIETLLKRVSENNPLLETPQKLRDYPIVSWEGRTVDTCVGPLFSVEEIIEIHGTVWEIYCKSGQPEPDKLAMQKIAYDIYLYIICLQHCLKAIFSLTAFEKSEIDNDNSFILSKITDEIRSSFGLDEDTIFATNYRQLLAAQYEEENFDVNFANEVMTYSRKAFDKILKRSEKLEFFEGFGEKNPLSSLYSLSKYVEKPTFVNEAVSGFYRQNYFRMTPNSDFKETLSPELKEIYNNLLIFLANRVESKLETFGLDALLLPGIFRLAEANLLSEYNKFLPELSLDYTAFPKNLKDSGYIEAYDYRNIIFKEDADKLRTMLAGVKKPADDYSFYYDFCEPFNNYMISLGGFNKYKNQTNHLRSLLLTLLDKPLSDFFSEFRFGRRYVVMVQQNNLSSSKNTIETVTEKVGNITRYHVQLQLINYEEDVPSMTARDLIFTGFPAYKQPKVSDADKAKAGRVASAIDLDFVEDIAVYLTYAGVEQVYGKKIDDLFVPTRKLAVTNVEALTRITSYEQSTDSVSSTSLAPPASDFNLFGVVFGAFLKAGANMTDPFWKTAIPGPLTPIGWAAKFYDADQPANSSEVGPPPKKEVCKDN